MDEFTKQVELRLLGNVLAPDKHNTEINACVREGITAEDFFYPQHKLMFQTIMDLFATGNQISHTAVEKAMIEKGRLSQRESSDMIITCLDAGNTYELQAAIEILPLLSARRFIIQTAREIAGDAQNQDIKTKDELISKAHDRLLTLNSKRQQSMTLTQYADNLRMDFEQHFSKAGTGIRSPFEQYGMMVGHYENGIHILAARPKVGKSSWCFAEMFAMALKGIPVGGINLELKNELILDRWVSDMAKVSTWRLRNREIDEEQFEKLICACEDIKTAPIYLAPPGLTLSQMFAWCRWAIQNKGVKYIVLDHAAKIRADKRYMSEYERISDYCNRITDFANEFIPMRTVVHLNRGVELRAAKTKDDDDKQWPTAADLRASGHWEQDAYTITFLHRKGGRDAKSEMIQDIECIIDENRNGPTGVIPFRFDRELHHWEEVDLRLPT